MQLNEHLEEWAYRHPEKVYLLYKDQRITYGQLLGIVNQLGNNFKDLGINKGDKVALYLRNRPEFLFAWFSLNKIGAVIVPINTAYKKQEASYIINNSGATWLIGEGGEILKNILLPLKETCQNLKQIITVEEDDSDEDYNDLLTLKELICGSPQLETIKFPDNELAALLYTSGTTDHPKGVMVHHNYYHMLGEGTVDALDLTTEDRLLTVLPLFHMNAQVLSTMGSLTAGGSLVFLDSFSATNFWKDVYNYEATVVNYLGSILPILMKQPVTHEEKNNKVKIFLGAQADVALIETYENRWNVKIVELYGMTEGGGSCNPVDKNKTKMGSCGLPSQGHMLRIVDENGRDLPQGEVGEIVVYGPSIALGYWQNKEETRKAYRDGGLFSGDMGRLDEDGYLYFVDRKKDIIRRSGENIAAAEIEKVVMAHPKVVEAAALPVPDPIRDEEVKVYVVLVEGETTETIPPQDIIDWCSGKLANFKVPRYVEYKELLPKTETNKVQKAVLKEEKDDLRVGSWDHKEGKWIN